MFLNFDSAFRAALRAVTAVLLVVSCSRGQQTDPVQPFDPDGHSYPHPGMTKCNFRIIGGYEGAGTKATSVSYSNESRINRWGLYIFDSEQNYVVSAASSSNGGIQKFLEPGTYTICAIVNYPTSGSSALNPDVQGGITTLSSLDSFIPRLEDMAANSFIMWGTDSMTIYSSEETDATIDVRRLVSKVGIKKISLAWANPGHATGTFVLKNIYLTNSYARQALRADIPYSMMSSVKSEWFNPMSYHGSGGRSVTSSVESMTADTGIDVTIPNNGSYNVEHYFYTLPNACAPGQDSHSATWGIRSTRMVIEATCAGETYYYSIQLPAMQRNKTYIADEVIIRNLGSLDPEQTVENSMTVRFSFSTSWDDVFVSENS